MHFFPPIYSYTRSLESNLYNKANEIQEDLSAKRYELHVASLHLAAVKSQVRKIYFPLSLSSVEEECLRSKPKFWFLQRETTELEIRNQFLISMIRDFMIDTFF